MLSAAICLGGEGEQRWQKKYLQTTVVIKIKDLSITTPPPRQICLGRR